MIDDYQIACLVSDAHGDEEDQSTFDYIWDGEDTGVWIGIKRYRSYDAVVFKKTGAHLINNELFAKFHDFVRPNPVVTGHGLGAEAAKDYVAFCYRNKSPAMRAVLFDPITDACLAQVTTSYHGTDRLTHDMDYYVRMLEA